VRLDAITTVGSLESVPELASEIVAGHVRDGWSSRPRRAERGGAPLTQDGGRPSCSALNPSIASDPGSRRYLMNSLRSCSTPLGVSSPRPP